VVLQPIIAYGNDLIMMTDVRKQHAEQCFVLGGTVELSATTCARP
jgi:hypothetical protein